MHPTRIKETFHFFIIALMMIVALPSFAASKDVTMQAGETETLYLPTSVTSLDLRSVTFYSNGISYVQVLSYNNYSVTVKAIKAFSSPIIVRCDYYYFVRNGGYTYQTKGYYDFKITVVGETKVQPTSISFPSTVVAVEVGESRQLTPTVYPADAEYTLTWSINDKSVATVSLTWISSDENVASVSGGNVKAVGIGECDVTVSTGNGLSAQCHVIVKPLLPTLVTLSAEEIVMTEGDTEQLTATVKPIGAEHIISWHSTDETIASVSSDGLVTALSEGSCRITATTGNNLMAECTVHVQKAAVEPTGISIISYIELTIGDVYDIVPDIKPADALTSLSWESDNSAVASVENGSITALSEGECNVTVTTSNNLSAVCHVVVKAKVVTPESIELSEYDVTLTVGESRTLTASVYPVDASATIDWMSTDENVATVSDGCVVAIGADRCEIIASAGNGIENRPYRS